MPKSGLTKREEAISCHPHSPTPSQEGKLPLEVWALEGEGEDVTLGEGNLKKMGRGSHGHKGQKTLRFKRTNRAANREPEESTCS